jgi:hypothetical protein
MSWKKDVMVALRTLQADIHSIDERLALTERQASDDHVVVERLDKVRMTDLERRASQIERSVGTKRA